MLVAAPNVLSTHALTRVGTCCIESRKKTVTQIELALEHIILRIPDTYHYYPLLTYYILEYTWLIFVLAMGPHKHERMLCLPM